MVPAVQKLLQELRMLRLHGVFLSYDSGTTEGISQPDCLSALEEACEASARVNPKTWQVFWASYKSEFTPLFEVLRQDDGKVDFGDFLRLVRQLEEMQAEFLYSSEKRAAQLGSVPPTAERQHFGELAYLHQTFCRQVDREDEDEHLKDIIYVYVYV